MSTTITSEGAMLVRMAYAATERIRAGQHDFEIPRFTCIQCNVEYPESDKHCDYDGNQRCLACRVSQIQWEEKTYADFYQIRINKWRADREICAECGRRIEFFDLELDHTRDQNGDAIDWQLLKDQKEQTKPGIPKNEDKLDSIAWPAFGRIIGRYGLENAYERVIKETAKCDCVHNKCHRKRTYERSCPLGDAAAKNKEKRLDEAWGLIQKQEGECVCYLLLDDPTKCPLSFGDERSDLNEYDILLHPCRINSKIQPGTVILHTYCGKKLQDQQSKRTLKSIMDIWKERGSPRSLIPYDYDVLMREYEKSEEKKNQKKIQKQENKVRKEEKDKKEILEAVSILEEKQKKAKRQKI